MRGVANPPPGTVYFGCAATADGEHIAVFPVIRGRDGRDRNGDTIELFSSTRAAMERTGVLNRLHRELLLDNIRNSREAA